MCVCVYVLCMYVCMYERMYACMYVLMCVCMYVCMSVCVYVCTCESVHVFMYVCMYVRVNVCMCLCTYVCMYERMYACMYVCMCVCMFVCLYVCMYVRVNICTCLYMYVCTYAQYCPHYLVADCAATMKHCTCAVKCLLSNSKPATVSECNLNVVKGFERSEILPEISEGSLATATQCCYEIYRDYRILMYQVMWTHYLGI